MQFWQGIVVFLGARVVLAQDDLPTSSTGCVCVPYNLCSDTGEIITDGFSIFGIRVGPDEGEECRCPASQNDYGQACAGFVNVCCRLPQSTDVPTNPPDVPTNPPDVPTNPTTVPTKPVEPIYTTVTEEPEGSWEICGIKGNDPINNRVLTNDSDDAPFFEEFPWMAVLTDVTLNTSTKMICGASIIHPYIVLTAAHCVLGRQAPQLLVRAGVWSFSLMNLAVPQDQTVDRIIIHPQFVQRNLRNDVALLILQKPLKLAQNIGPICLPDANTRYDNMTCTATGWGSTIYNSRDYSDDLKKVDLRIVPHNECQRELRKTTPGAWFILHQSFVCAQGKDGRDTCTGDGGGPLVCRKKDEEAEVYVQVGITAAGLQCGSNYPALYANVPLFVPWIKNVISSLKFPDTV